MNLENLQPPTIGSWPAKLEARFQKSAQGRTELVRCHHSGPLRIQRLFHDQNLAHCYILHPPGGVVSGDSLALDFNARSGSKVLVTTPASGKVYRARKTQPLQRQSQTITVGEDAFFALLPQDNIAFDGAQALNTTRIELAKSSVFMGWEQWSLGRPYGGYDFKTGRLRQALNIHRDGQPLLHEALDFTPEMLTNLAVLNGATSFAAFWWCAPDLLPLDELRKLIKRSSVQSAATQISPGLICARLAAREADYLRETLESIFFLAGSHSLQRPVSSPRIWRT